MRRLSYCSEHMSNDMSEICNPVMTVLLVLVGLVIAGVALFFAMNFGNTLSIPGVITLLILGVIVIALLWYLLSDARTEAKVNSAKCEREREGRKQSEKRCKQAEERREQAEERREQAELGKRRYEHQANYYLREYERERNKWFFQRWFGL